MTDVEQESVRNRAMVMQLVEAGARKTFTWLVLGNFGALGFLYHAVFEGNVAFNIALKAVALLFIVGAFSAGYAALLAAPALHFVDDRSEGRRTQMTVAAIISAGCLVAGLATPLFVGVRTSENALCQAAAQLCKLTKPVRASLSQRSSRPTVAGNAPSPSADSVISSEPTTSAVAPEGASQVP